MTCRSASSCWDTPFSVRARSHSGESKNRCHSRSACASHASACSSVSFRTSRSTWLLSVRPVPTTFVTTVLTAPTASGSFRSRSRDRSRRVGRSERMTASASPFCATHESVCRREVEAPTYPPATAAEKRAATRLFARAGSRYRIARSIRFSSTERVLLPNRASYFMPGFRRRP